MRYTIPGLWWDLHGGCGGSWERTPNPIFGVRHGSGKAFHKKLFWSVCRVGWSDCVPPGKGSRMWQVPDARQRKFSFFRKFQGIQYGWSVWLQVKLKTWAKVKATRLPIPLCQFHILQSMLCVWTVPPKLLNFRPSENTACSSLSFWHCWNLTPTTFSEYASRMTQPETVDIESSHGTCTFACLPSAHTY